MKSNINLDYKDRVQLLIERINKIRNVSSTGKLNEYVKHVCVFLSSSRSGSSLMKTILSKSKDVVYLSGEEEPFYILTSNGFPWSSDSDKFNSDVNNKQELLDNIFDELGVNTKDIDFNKLIHDWHNRLTLQVPTLQEQLFKNVETIWREIEASISDENDFTYLELNQLFLKKFFNGMQDFGYYDVISENTPFLINGIDKVKIEEPPFVIPEQKRKITIEDCDNKVFIFKTPQDCYRIGLFEKLFPNAEIKYIHLSRGFAQTVNGLMDGWLSETGFFAHNLDIINERLNIEGYTDKIHGGDRWWNFDLPPNWKEYKDKPLERVCLNQWYESHSAIFSSGVETLRIKFENFTINPQETINEITDYLGINKITIKKLPVIMATSLPSEYRWIKRKDIIESLVKEAKTNDMMYKLGYSMDQKTWI